MNPGVQGGSFDTLGERDPKPYRRLWWLYAPWAWLVFIPFLVLSTLFWGIVVLSLSPFSARLAYRCGMIWAWCLCRVNFTRVKVIGWEHVRPGQSYIIMSNHQSHFDALALIGHLRLQIRWVLKEELGRIPVFGWYCVAGGHILIDRSSREKAIESLKRSRGLVSKGVSVIIFPEGTRTQDGRIGEFKKGGFMMALDLGLPILPVTISGTRRILPSGTLKLLPGKILIQIHAPVDVNAYGPEQRDRLMEDVKRAIASQCPAC